MAMHRTKEASFTSTKNTVETIERRGLGILAIFCAVFLFVMTDVIAKWYGEMGFPPNEIVFFRYAFGVIPVGYLVWRSGVDSLRTRHPYAHALRAGLIVSALGLFFSAISLMPLAEAVAVAFVAPLFVTSLSVPLLGEHVGIRRWVAVFLGFVGALIVLQPGTGAFRPEALLVVGSALSFSLAMILTRKMTRTETTISLFSYTTIGATLISAPFLGFAWQTPGTVHLLGFLVLGVVSSVAAFLIIVAYKNAPASVIAPFEYTALIWASLAGWVIWNEQPESTVWIGATIIILSSLYVAKREASMKNPR
jgi:drug/metabolite transporter (DMT)-like permease